MKQNQNELESYENEELELDFTLSYSRVSDFARNGVKTLKERKFVTSDGAKLGGLIDDMLFEPDTLEIKYYIFKQEKPTATLGTICEIIFSNYPELPRDIDSIVFDIIEENKFWSNIKKKETLYNKFAIPEFYGYITAMYESKERVIITQEEWDLSEKIVGILKNHEYSKDTVAYPEEHEDKYVQFKIEYKYGKFTFRGLLDMLIVNHKDKTVKMVDLKTGKNSASEFKNSYIKWCYYLQEAIYTMAFEHICEELKLEGYTLLPFEFLYISRYEAIPIRYVVSDKWHRAAKSGFKINTYKYRGLDELLDEIYWHWFNKKFDLSREIYEQNGCITLKDDFIEVDE